MLRIAARWIAAAVPDRLAGWQRADEQAVGHAVGRYGDALAVVRQVDPAVTVTVAALGCFETAIGKLRQTLGA